MMQYVNHTKSDQVMLSKTQDIVELIKQSGFGVVEGRKAVLEKISELSSENRGTPPLVECL